MVNPKVISEVKLENIQSWGPDSEWVKFNEVGMNVFIARSETGKSVLFKVFETACFPHKRGLKGRRSLIRRRCAEGKASIRMANGTLITFIFRPSKTLFTMQKINEPVQHFEMPRLPDEIQEELGWIVDYDNKIILNLIDSSDGTGRLFISTTSKYNASVTRCITTEPKTTTAFNSVNEWIDLIQEKVVGLQPHVVRLQACIANTPYVNEKTLEVNVEAARQLLACWEPLSEASEQLHYLEATVSSKPPQVKSFDDATWVYTSIQPVHHAQAEFDALQQIVLRKPQSSTQEVDYELCQTLITVNNSVQQALAGFRELVQQALTKPQLSKFDFHLATCLNTANNTLLSTHGLYNETIRELQAVISERKHIAELEREVKDLGNTLGKCPVCGSDITTS